MHVLIAPDSFGPELTAVEAGAVIAEGWTLGAPHDEVEVVPMSSGGVGFVDALHGAIGGELLLVSVTGSAGEMVPATILRVGSSAYVEAAQVCGLDLASAAPGSAQIWRATSYGVGQLIAASIDAGSSGVVVALGSVGTNDGGAGLLAALGAMPTGVLAGGPTALVGLTTVDLSPAVERTRHLDLIAATDVDNPLLGLRGTTNLFAVGRGAAAADLPAIDAALAAFAALVDADLANTPGAGAGGGTGYALAALGAARRPVLDLVIELVDLPARARQADLVVTATRRFDGSSLRGAVVAGVARTAGPTGRPCVVLADVVEVGRREMNAYGVESAYAVRDHAAGGRPGGRDDLRALASRVARSWSPAR